MSRIKFDTETVKLMMFFESATGAKLRDCFTDDLGVLTFVVNEGIGKAIGRGGSTFKRLEAGLRKKIRIISYSEALSEFITNLIMPLRARSITLNPDDRVVTIDAEPESRGYIIGRAAKSLRNYEAITKRYFTIKEIKVV